MSIPEQFRAFRIHSGVDSHQASIESVGLPQLSEGEVVIKTAYSSINYKDALAGTGKGKILRRSPLIGGIDVAGHVVTSRSAAFREGDAVLCTGCGLSETRDGGYSEFVRLPAEATIPLPTGLDLRESMILGTAGFTAALSLYRMEQNGQHPEQGPIVVTGATGGVGMLAINLLATAGYTAHAITGKMTQLDFLTALGAKQVISRQDLHWGQRPLENAIWAGAIDSVGSDMLAGLTRVIHPHGNVASCGLAAGPGLHTTVMPFIIRGISLLGIASAGTPRAIREVIWQRLATDWKPSLLAEICTRTVAMDDLPAEFKRLIDGGGFGRTLVEFA